MIRIMQTTDVMWASRQHAKLMNKSVFAMFGVKFLACFYRRFAKSKHAIAFVYEESGLPRGVIASANNRSAFLRELLLIHGIELIFFTIASLRKSACRHLLFQLPRYFDGSKKKDINAEMIFITISPESRGNGIAQELIQNTLDEFVRRGVEKVNVTTESDKKNVIDILHDMGFAVIDEFMFADKSNLLFEKTLNRK